MSVRTIHRFFALLLVIASLSCKKSTPTEGIVAAQAKSDERAQAGSHAGEAHEQGAEAKEPSDLDRPVEELVALTCEHKKKTFECDECRYEVGFVRAPASLREGGLLTTVHVERQKVAVPIALTGEVRFDERRVGHVSTQVQGIIKKVHVALGGKVKKGEPLLEIESVAVGETQATSPDTACMTRTAPSIGARSAMLPPVVPPVPRRVSFARAPVARISAAASSCFASRNSFSEEMPSLRSSDTRSKLLRAKWSSPWASR
jgi:biotin carboxyl carrier protein